MPDPTLPSDEERQRALIALCERKAAIDMREACVRVAKERAEHWRAMSVAGQGASGRSLHKREAAEWIARQLEDLPLPGDPERNVSMYCDRCDNQGVVNCYCGGDLCVCTNYGERDCPKCHGDCGGYDDDYLDDDRPEPSGK